MPAPTSELELLISQWESDDTLLTPAGFRARIEILDQLDSMVPGTAGPDLASARASALRSRLESANTAYYNQLRSEIQSGACPLDFRSILRDSSTPAPRGLHFDHLDDLLAGVFQFDPPSEEPRHLGADSVFYQPTPARHIFHLITAGAITPADTIIDLGSGLGHVPLIVSICTGATSIGIELDPALIASASSCAASLNLHNVSFLARDAQEADLSAGTVFYLYTPFTGSTLASVLDSLRLQASLRPIRICTFGPCTLTIAQQPWLRAFSPPATDQITIFTPQT